MQDAIFYPMASMVLLTMIVWFVMYAKRIRYIVQHNVTANRLSNPEKIHAELPEYVNAASNNFKNLFELPILFYVVCLVLHQLMLVNTLFIGIAYAFVFFRSLHSYIHCQNGSVIWRFTFYILSALLLFVMWFGVFTYLFHLLID